MRRNDPTKGAVPEDDGDGLAELVRAAGHRKAPPQADYVAVRAAAHEAWQASVHARRRRFFALAASILVAVSVLVGTASVLMTGRMPVAELARSAGEVDTFPASDDTWRPLTEQRAALFRGDRLRTGSGGAVLDLAEAGELRIDAGTELRFMRSGTIELTRGTIYVDSGAAEAEGPGIEIVTELGRIRDIGTRFEVRREPAALRIRVRSGRVALIDSPLDGDVEAPAGEELELGGAGRLERRSIAPDAASWGWASALALVPSGTTTVHGYLEWIAYETGKVLRFESANTELRTQFVRWSGDVSGLTPLQILEAIAATSDFTYELSGDGSILIGLD